MKIRDYTGIALLVTVSTFIIQNAAVVNIRFLIWKLSISLSLVIIFMVIAGVIAGWLVHGIYRKKNGKQLHRPDQ